MVHLGIVRNKEMIMHYPLEETDCDLPIGTLVCYIHGYGKRKTEYIGEFKGYEGDKVRIGRWEFKDQVVMKERFLGVFHSPEDGVILGNDTTMYDE